MLLERFAYTKYGALGRLTLDALEFYTIELPWRGNERRRSCIPEGVYEFQRHESPRFGETIWIRGVPERTEILIHVANSPQDLDGCIGPGKDYGWWADRSELAVWNSSEALDKILRNIPYEGSIDVRTWRPECP